MPYLSDHDKMVFIYGWGRGGARGFKPSKWFLALVCFGGARNKILLWPSSIDRQWGAASLTLLFWHSLIQVNIKPQLHNYNAEFKGYKSKSIYSTCASKLN